MPHKELRIAQINNVDICIRYDIIAGSLKCKFLSSILDRRYGSLWTCLSGVQEIYMYTKYPIYLHFSCRVTVCRQCFMNCPLTNVIIWVHRCIEAMLLGLFRNVDGCVLDPPKVVHFWRIRHGCGSNFGESEQLSIEAHENAIKL